MGWSFLSLITSKTSSKTCSGLAVSSPCFFTISLKKQLLEPVWQAAPTWDTLAKSVSLSQSAARLFRYWKWPLVSPLSQSCLRLRL